MNACCLVMLMLMSPRLVLIALWMFTDYFDVFQTWYWPLLGIFFMPFTTLTYMGAMWNNGGVSGWWLVLLILAVIMDWGSNGSAANGSKDDKDDKD